MFKQRLVPLSAFICVAPMFSYLNRYTFIPPKSCWHCGFRVGPTRKNNESNHYLEMDDFIPFEPISMD